MKLPSQKVAASPKGPEHMTSCPHSLRGFWGVCASLKTRVQISVLTFSCCVTLDRSLDPFEPQFPLLQNGNNYLPKISVRIRELEAHKV